MNDLTHTSELDRIKANIRDAQSMGDVVGATYDLQNFLKTKAVGETWKKQFNLESSERQGIEDVGVAAVLKMASFGREADTKLEVDQDAMQQQLGDLAVIFDGVQNLIQLRINDV